MAKTTQKHENDATQQLLADRNGYATFHTQSDNDHSETDSDTTPSATYANASWFSRLVFGYATPVLTVGNARQLEMDDLWHLDGEIRSSVAYTKFKTAYVTYNRSVVKAIVASFGGKFLLSGLGSMAMAACAVFAPAVLHHVIDACTAPTVDLENMTMWVAAFFASRVVNAFTEAHVNFTMEMALLQLTVSLKGLLFEKAMRRSIQSKNDNDVVDVSNLFTADIDNLMWAGYQINVIWITPMQVAVVVYMLYNVLDVAAFAGLGVIFISLGLNFVVAKGYMAAYNEMMKCKDTRMKVVKEVFSAIHVIKLDAWETKFLGRIRTWRANETRAIARYLYLMAISIFLFWGAPLCVSVVSFATYAIVLNKELTAAKVFTSMVLFMAIRNPLSQFPDALQAILQAWLAIGRIATYLAADEVYPERITRSRAQYDSDVLVSVENATFSGSAIRTSALILQRHTGDFVVVHGAVGSGKSSLCAALLGELPKQRGNVFVRSRRVAYYSQQPWIQHMSIRDNILFGLPYDKTKYDRVIDACGLVKDIAMFPARDATEIGQKGVNLSGGQKARVSLARACYANADLYILDTLLAAVDAVVQSEIFNKCFCGLLENKTIVLVSHLHDVITSPAVNVELLVENNSVTVNYTHRTKPRRAYATLHTDAEVQDAAKAEPADEIIDGETKDTPEHHASGTLVQEEEREDGRVSSDVFLAYVRALGGVNMLVGFVVALVCWQSFQAGSDVWLSHWTGSKPVTETTATTEANLTVYALLTLGAGSFVFVVDF